MTMRSPQDRPRPYLVLMGWSSFRALSRLVCAASGPPRGCAMHGGREQEQPCRAGRQRCGPEAWQGVAGSWPAGSAQRGGSSRCQPRRTRAGSGCARRRSRRGHRRRGRSRRSAAAGRAGGRWAASERGQATMPRCETPRAGCHQQHPGVCGEHAASTSCLAWRKKRVSRGGGVLFAPMPGGSSGRRSCQSQRARTAGWWSAGFRCPWSRRRS